MIFDDLKRNINLETRKNLSTREIDIRTEDEIAGYFGVKPMLNLFTGGLYSIADIFAPWFRLEEIAEILISTGLTTPDVALDEASDFVKRSLIPHLSRRIRPHCYFFRERTDSETGETRYQMQARYDNKEDVFPIFEMIKIRMEV